jgi:hypothetical protein
MDWIPTLGDRQAQYRRYRLIAQIVHPVGTHWPRATDRRVATFARDLRRARLHVERALVDDVIAARCSLISHTVTRYVARSSRLDQ